MRITWEQTGEESNITRWRSSCVRRSDNGPMWYGYINNWGAFGYPERDIRLGGCAFALVSGCVFLVALGFVLARWLA